MAQELNLIPATEEDLQRSLAFALIFDGKKLFRRADDLMAQITARHLVEHLQMSGYVLMHKPPAAKPSVGDPRKRLQDP